MSIERVTALLEIILSAIDWNTYSLYTECSIGVWSGGEGKTTSGGWHYASLDCRSNWGREEEDIRGKGIGQAMAWL